MLIHIGQDVGKTAGGEQGMGKNDNGGAEGNRARRVEPRRLTKRTVDSIRPGAPKGTWHADAELTGFFLVSYASGQKVFFVRYRVNGRRRVMKVGAYGELTPEQALEKAKD